MRTRPLRLEDNAAPAIARRPGADLAPLDERRRDAAQRQLPRYRRPTHPTPDNDHIRRHYQSSVQLPIRRNI